MWMLYWNKKEYFEVSLLLFELSLMNVTTNWSWELGNKSFVLRVKSLNKKLNRYSNIFMNNKKLQEILKLMKKF